MWTGNFGSTIGALNAYLADKDPDAIVWMDIFAVNQWPEQVHEAADVRTQCMRRLICVPMNHTCSLMQEYGMIMAWPDVRI